MRRSGFIFKENHVFIEVEDNPSDKVVMVEEELDGTGNLMGLPRLMFIDEECGNLKVTLKNLLEIMTERRIQKFYKPIVVNTVTNAIDEIEESMIFIAATFLGGRL